MRSPCDCYGLGAGQELVLFDSNLTETDACQPAEACFTYLDEYDDRLCSCGGVEFSTPEGASDVAEAESCPP